MPNVIFSFITSCISTYFGNTAGSGRGKNKKKRQTFS
jgi:hypothetical protein